MAQNVANDLWTDCKSDLEGGRYCKQNGLMFLFS